VAPIPQFPANKFHNSPQILGVCVWTKRNKRSAAARHTLEESSPTWISKYILLLPLLNQFYQTLSTFILQANYGTRSNFYSSTSTMMKHVRFGTVEIREYDIVLGDNVPSSGGVAISIDWSYSQDNIVKSVQDYENDHGQAHKQDELLLPRTQRRDLYVFFINNGE
jgi:hypothetical protein